MFDYDFKEAEQYLTFAFEHCHKSSKANKRQILTYLIPVKMLLGHMPNQAVLEKYDLMQFNEVVQAVKQGNLLRFDTSFQGLLKWCHKGIVVSLIPKECVNNML